MSLAKSVELSNVLLTCSPGLSKRGEYQMLGSLLKYQQFVKICEELTLLNNNSLSFTN